MDEEFAAAVGSPKRLFSHHSLRGSRRRRHGSGSDSESADISLQKQISFERQTSVLAAEDGKPKLKRLTSKKQQEEWDKDMPEVCVKCTPLLKWRVHFLLFCIRPMSVFFFLC